MVSGVDTAIAIGTTLKIITDRLKFPVIPTIVYTDLYSLYKYLVKLSTIKEKRLIINIIALNSPISVKNSLKSNGLIAKII